MIELKFVKSGKEYKVFANEKEVGKMYKDNKRNYQFAVVVKWNFKVQGFKNECYGRTYKQVKSIAQKMYNELMDLHKKGFKIIELDC